ncbi:type II toxin-antitoxin system Phd/YefM family antitoxin [Candidatus Mycolicibacterium alkanivorans]|uniref:Type II toxin-antitoxin system prevent-host-death family antitoxin n=1 Tax=Candidatus Mycolicibacterium alkanivorans TaxID=2954114 RepID=A0ABS9YUF4_9MYCO|nr:type II toxin-antitoxin system prevent-host-death family antitoxin [Candidatus Mycolicibacterium alkanivorans]MCI4674777.1 type II toxin-antitoxin system prevent-host-death family antitoxin [Candidatus Mycolicibacterium alkanivorans]
MSLTLSLRLRLVVLTDFVCGGRRISTQRVADCSTPCYNRAMAKTIAQRELRNQNAKVIEAVAAGETFIVTRNGEPVAELRPIRADRRTFIARDEVVALAAAGVRIDHRQFRADLDRLIDQGL